MKEGEVVKKVWWRRETWRDRVRFRMGMRRKLKGWRWMVRKRFVAVANK